MGIKRQASDADDDESPNPSKSGPSTAPKRQRVSRACDQCRAAREKCDGIQPRCFPCTSQNRNCTWAEPKKKRGVQTGYIRTLELALGWIFDKIPGAEESLHDLLAHEGGQGRALLTGKDTATGNRLHRRWRRSTVHREIDRVLSGGDVTCAKVDQTGATGDDSDSGDEAEAAASGVGLGLAVKEKLEAETSLLSELAEAEPQQLVSGRLESVNPSTRPPQPQAGSSSGSPPLRLVLPSNHWRLLDVYTSYTHSWFPVLEKHDILKTCYTYRAEGLQISPDDPNCAAHAELWAALALASFQETASRRGKGEQTPDGTTPPEDIYWIARSLIPTEKSTFSVRHVNSLLLLTLINMGQGDLRAAWILIGFASRIAIGLSLHLGVSSDGSRRSHHAYMGCFILDTVISAHTNRPPHLRTDDAKLALPSLEDDLDEWQPWIPCDGFVPNQQTTLPSRNPSHAVSSFQSLYGIHKVLSYNLFTARDAPSPHEDRFLVQIQHAISDYDKLQPFTDFIIHEATPMARLPSLYLLRLAFLSTGGCLNSLPDTLPSKVLRCMEEYISNFGASSMAPIFTTFGSVIAQHYNFESLLLPEERQRWKRVEGIMNSIWLPGSPFSAFQSKQLLSPSSRAHFSHPSASNGRYRRATANTAIQQLPTPIAFYPDQTADQSAIPDEVSQTTDLAKFGEQRDARPGQGGNGVMTPSSGMFQGLGDMPTSHYPSLPRPSFSNSGFDYDSLLDDIASLERTDQMESDPQFMANLGFAPGSNLADVLAHEYLGGFSSG